MSLPVFSQCRVIGVARMFNPFVIDWVVAPTLKVAYCCVPNPEGSNLLTKNDLPVRYSPAMVITATGLLSDYKNLIA